MAMIQCRECGSNVSSKAQACPKCGNPVKGVLRRKSPIGCCGVIVLGGFFGFVLIVLNTARNVADRAGNEVAPPAPPAVPITPHVSTPPAPQGAESPVATGVETNEAVTIARPGGAGHAHVCTDRPAYDELQRLLKGMDEGHPEGLGRFSQLSHDEGRILWIQNGTRAIALRTENGARFVKLVDGYKAGQSGWVDAQYVFPDEAAPVASDEPSKPASPKAKRRPRPAEAPIDPEKHAATILQLGKNLERDGKPGAALDNYQRILAEFPTSAAATEAAKRAHEINQ